MNNNPETYHTLMTIFSDKGTPASFRHARIWGINTFKFIRAEVRFRTLLDLHACTVFRNSNTILTYYHIWCFCKKDKSFSYFRIYMVPNQGIKNLTQQEAEALGAKDPDYYSRDLFQSIANRDFPSWEVSAQILSPQQAEAYPVNIFDPTKVWPADFPPVQPFGTITLNQNPARFFDEVEQAAFTPASVVPGWDVTLEPSMMHPSHQLSMYNVFLPFLIFFYFTNESWKTTISSASEAFCLWRRCSIPIGNELPSVQN